MMIPKMMTRVGRAAAPGAILLRACGMAHIGAPQPLPPQDVAGGNTGGKDQNKWDWNGNTGGKDQNKWDWSRNTGGKDQNKWDWNWKYQPNVKTEQIGTVAFMTLFIYYYNEARQNTMEQIKNLHLVHEKERLMKKIEEGKQEQMELRACLEKLEEEKRKMAEEMLVAETRLQELQTRVAEKEKRSYRFWPPFSNK